MKTDYKKILRYEYFGAGIILFLFFVFDLYPNIVDAFLLKGKIHFARVSVKSISDAEKTREVAKLQKELNGAAGDLSLAKKGVSELYEKAVDEGNIALITLSVEEIATKAGVELNYVRPSETITVKEFELLPINIGCQGSYSTMIAFLSEIENAEKKLTVKSVSISSQKSGPEMLDLELTIEVVLKAGDGNKNS